MSLSSFVESLFNQNQSPCEKFRCENFSTCREKRLACESFVHYVQTGHSASPRLSRFTYNSGNIFATEAIYWQLFRE